MASRNPLTNSGMLGFVYGTGFIFGLALCFDSVFMPEFKEYFHLDYTEQMYIMFSKNSPFLLFSLLIGYVIKKTGFKNCLALGILLFAIGTFLLIPGLKNGDYRIILLAFFINGIAFNLELVSWNPLLTALGNPEESSSRLNLGNALGAVAQIIAPLLILLIIPIEVVTIAAKLPYIERLFQTLSIILLIFSIFAFSIKSPPIRFEVSDPVKTPGSQGISTIWKNSTLLFGFIAIFLVLGVESSIFGLYRNFLEDPAIAGLSAHESQKMFTIYFSLFALGRLAAWAIQKKINPAVHTAVSIIIVIALICIAIFFKGTLAVWSLTLTGFFISTFFPSLYSISIRGLGSQTAMASGLLTMGMLGAAILPVMQGKLADRFNLQHSFLIAIIPYLFALLFVLRPYWSKGSPDNKHNNP